MAETTDATNSLELQLAKDAKEVSEKMTRIEELTEIQYVPGFENKVGFFPKLESLEEGPVLARFSYGKDSPNMSSVFFDSAKGESSITGDRNTRDFLDSQGFTGTVIQVLGKFEGNEPQIEEVDRDTASDKIKVVGNLVFTRDPEVTLIIKPADCPTAIIYCKDEHGNPLVAIDHGGADAVNAGITRQGVWALKNILGVDLSQAQVAIFPGVSQDNFFISREWKTTTGEIKRRDNGIPEMNWREHIKSAKTSDLEEKRYVDITSALEMQLLEAGIPPTNIQAYRRDTYKDAENGIAYSRRYSNDHARERDGGQVVAVQLKPDKVEKESFDNLLKAA
ncbi:MAG TPA: laccase domain-containing protein [Candidatus Sulfotelmatobacter sp.]|nr:laccase domain-containing protein [Candidatus Sulfotelmatobacter sp.]